MKVNKLKNEDASKAGTDAANDAAPVLKALMAKVVRDAI